MTLVEGRLIDGQTGEPLAGAWIMGMSDGFASDEHVARSKADNAEERASYAEHGAAPETWQEQGLLDPEATTGSDGRFRLRQWVGTSTATAHSGRILSQTGHEPRTGMDVLYIEREGHPPVRVPVPEGTFLWIEGARRGTGGVGALWDLGDVAVPRPPTR